jgi:hypothetical protein
MLFVALGLPYRFLVGNGFKTWLAAFWILLLTLLGMKVFGQAYLNHQLIASKSAGAVIPFQPFVYSLDVLLPIVDFGQADGYLPSAAGDSYIRIFYWAQTALGWVLATALAASAGGALKRGQVG